MPALRRNMMSRISVLGAEDCRRIEAALLELQGEWRSPELVLSTLGSPVYRNLDDLGRYYAHAARDNPLLRRHFWWLYARLFKVLESCLELPLSLLPGLALPGFHILDLAGGYHGGGFHIDAGHEALGLSSCLDVADNVSFTLAVHLPCETGVDIAGGEGGAPEGAARHFSFLTGHLHIFSGQRSHQIAPCAPVLGRRITLQGHVVPFENRALVFW